MIRKLVIIVLAVFLVQFSVRGEHVVFDWRAVSDTCPILDDIPCALYEVSFCYVPSRSYGDYGKSSTLEFDLDWELAYYRDVLNGDLGVSLNFSALMLTSATQLHLPDQLVGVFVEPEWTWRYAKGRAIQISARPGIYSDMEDLDMDMFYVPMSCRFVRAFEPRLSAYAGLEVRPGFDKVFIPLIGVKYEINEMLVFEGGWPSIRMDYYFDRDWRTYAGLDWNNTTYSLSEKGTDDRGAITLEDYRLYVGLSHQTSEDFLLTAEVGYVFEESVVFAKDLEDFDRKVSEGSSYFLKFGVSRSF
ncbi:hypothetical protein KAH81_09210 [bacterium]|nr:hypothetical protein [bacterium]